MRFAGNSVDSWQPLTATWYELSISVAQSGCTVCGSFGRQELKCKKDWARAIECTLKKRDE